MPHKFARDRPCVFVSAAEASVIRQALIDRLAVPKAARRLELDPARALAQEPNTERTIAGFSVEAYPVKEGEALRLTALTRSSSEGWVEGYRGFAMRIGGAWRITTFDVYVRPPKKRYEVPDEGAEPTGRARGELGNHPA